MSDILKKWLKNNLDRMMSVQTTLLNPANADITIVCWSGVKINVHFITEPTRTRNLKKTLQDATSTGINTMFLLDVSLMPQDGQRILMKDWLMALHHLTNNRVYVYRLQKTGIELFQIHFEPMNNGSDEYKVWYGPQVPFERLRSYRAAVKPRYIRGDWLVADFGMPDFWRNTDYRQYQTRQDRSYRHTHNQTQWQEWSGYQQTWSNYTSDRTERPLSPLQQHLDACYALLGVERNADPAEVKRAFRKCAIAFHPDTSKLPAEEAKIKFRQINEAYDYIKAANGWT